MVVRCQLCQATIVAGVDAARPLAYAQPVPSKRATPETPQTPAKRKAPPEQLRGFPGRLREAMDEANLNGKQLAELSGITAGQISRWLHGKRVAGIQAGVGIRVAMALNVRVGWLLAGEEPKRPSPRSIPVYAESPEAILALGEAVATFLKERNMVPEFRTHKPGAADEDLE